MFSKTEKKNQEPEKKSIQGTRFGETATFFFREAAKIKNGQDEKNEKNDKNDKNDKNNKKRKKSWGGENGYLGPPMVSFESPKKASCGVRAIWVNPKERGRGVGRQLLDTLRYTFSYGYVVPSWECAFSQPTSDGRAFAAKYCGTETFLVYR